MRKLSILLTIAIVALGASSALAFTGSITVSGNLALASSTTGCTSRPYPAICPTADDCVCYKLSKASLHSAGLPGGVSIPPGTTKAFFARDETDKTGSAGTCDPVYGEVDYTGNDGVSNAQIFVFGSLCTPSPLSPGGPLTVSGGGAIESAVLETPIGPLDVSGYGTAAGTYQPLVSPPAFTMSITGELTTP